MLSDRCSNPSFIPLQASVSPQITMKQGLRPLSTPPSEGQSEGPNHLRGHSKRRADGQELKEVSSRGDDGSGVQTRALLGSQGQRVSAPVPTRARVCVYLRTEAHSISGQTHQPTHQPARAALARHPPSREPQPAQ